MSRVTNYLLTYFTSLLELWRLKTNSHHKHNAKRTQIADPSLSSNRIWIARFNPGWKYQDIFLFETRMGDEKDGNNSPQRFGVLHLLQRAIVKRIRS